MARQGNTTQVGLGYPHQRDRKRAIAAMPDGTQCPLCGKPMWKQTQRLQYDHVIPRAIGNGTGLRRITHGWCNEQAGRQLGARLARSRRTLKPRRTAYTRW